MHREALIISKSMDNKPKFHADAFTLENQIRCHDWVERIYRQVNAVGKPLSDRAIAKLVAGKPVDPDQARQMVGPVDFERAMASGRGQWSFVRAVNREPVIAALVSKAVATRAAVVHLAKSGLSVDAFTLARTLLENVIVIAWLLPEDVSLRERRIDTFVLHMEAFLVHFETIALADHQKYGTTPDPNYGTTARTREISAEVFDDNWMFWPHMEDQTGKKNLVRLRQMAGKSGWKSGTTEIIF
jgi:hypothetical protein